MTGPTDRTNRPASGPVAPARAANAEHPGADLRDRAFAEALSQVAGLGRLSDDEVRAIRAARRRHIAAGATCVLALAVCAGAWQARMFAPPPVITAHYQTRPGQQLDLALADGSKLELDGATSIDVAIGGNRRQIDLQRGEAFFDIAHDPARPFVITAAGSRTRVLGTAFDIDVARHGVKLQVYRGLVRFGGMRGSVDVAAGWRSTFTGNAALSPTRFDPAQQDWRHNWLDTDGIRLEDLVDALNRSGGPTISSPPTNLAGLMLAGRFKLDDGPRLLSVIGPAYGFVAVRQGGQIVLKQSVPKPTSN
jgi:transmembrane sensor